MFSKILLMLFIAVVFSSAYAAPPTPWEVTVTSNLMGSFQYYSKNWKGDEKGAAAWTTQVNAELKRQLNERLHNRNMLKLAFGQTNYQESSRDGFADPIKSTDLVDFESLLKITLESIINPFVGVRFISQFLDQSDPSQTYYLNPSELTESFGGAVQIVKNEHVDLVTRLGGAVRQTFNQHDAIDHTNDGGLELVSELTTSNRDGWVKFQSFLKIYEALFRSGDPVNENWKHPDVNWENTLIVNLNKYLMLNVYTQLLYDKEINIEARFKNVTSLGITYMFSNAAKATNQ